MKIFSFFAIAFLLAPLKSYSYTISLPPGNLVENPNFVSLWSDWSGSSVAILNRWSSVPNDNCVLDQDLYQDIATTPGQTYSVSFYAAADLFFAQSVTIDLDINSQLLTSFTTPSYSYDNTQNRYDQMHWQVCTATFEATSSTTQLEFVDANTYDFGLTGISMIPISVPVPEPGTLALLAGGGILGLVMRYRSVRRVESF